MQNCKIYGVVFVTDEAFPPYFSNGLDSPAHAQRTFLVGMETVYAEEE